MKSVIALKDRLFLEIVKQYPNSKIVLIILNYIVLVFSILFFLISVCAIIILFGLITQAIPKTYVENVLKYGLNFDFSILVYSILGLLFFYFIAYFTFKNIKRTSIKNIHCQSYSYQRVYCKHRHDEQFLDNKSRSTKGFVFIILASLLISIIFFTSNYSYLVEHKNNYIIQKAAWIRYEKARIDSVNSLNETNYKLQKTLYENYPAKRPQDSIDYVNKLVAYKQELSKYKVVYDDAKVLFEIRHKRWVNSLDYWDKIKYDEISRSAYKRGRLKSVDEIIQDNCMRHALGEPFFVNPIGRPEIPLKPNSPTMPKKVVLLHFKDLYPVYSNDNNDKYLKFWDVNKKRDIKYNILPVIIISILIPLMLVLLVNYLHFIVHEFKNKSDNIIQFVLMSIVGAITFSNFSIKIFYYFFRDNIDLSNNMTCSFVSMLFVVLFLHLSMFFYKKILCKINELLSLGNVLNKLFILLWITLPIIIEILAYNVGFFTLRSDYSSIFLFRVDKFNYEIEQGYYFLYVGWYYFIILPSIYLIINWIFSDRKTVNL